MTKPLAKLRDLLTAPLTGDLTAAEVREARLVSATLLLLIIMGIFSQVVADRFYRYGTNIAEAHRSVFVYAFIGLVILLYGLSRTRHYRAAIMATTALSVVGVILVATVANQPPSPDFLAYLLIPILLVSIFLSVKKTLVVALISLLSMLAIPLFEPGISWLELAAGPLSYLLITTGVYLFATHYRASLDRLRRSRLAETERRYRALFEHANDGILILDFEGRHLGVNRRMTEIIGYSADELIGRSFYDIIAPEEHGEAALRLQTLVGGKIPPIYERMLLTKDGDEILVELNTTVVYDERGDPAYIQSTIRDISERKAAQASLSRRHRDLTVLNRIIRATTSTMDEAQILQTLCGELAYAFELPHVYAALIEQGRGYAEVVAGYTAPGRPDLRGQQISLEVPAIAHVLQEKASLRIVDAAQDPRIDSWMRAPLRDSAGVLIVPLLVRDRVVSVVTMVLANPETLDSSDVELIHNAAAAVAQAIETARLYQEQQRRAVELTRLVEQRTAELQDALVQARAADRAKSQFVSNVSHELRTPLTSIRLYLDLAERGKPERLKTYLSALIRETDRLQTLVESLLLISRLDLKKIRLDPRMVDLNAVASTLVADRGTLFTENGLGLTFAGDPDLPVIPADRQLIEQVLTNLLTNAMNYTPEGGNVRVATRRVVDRDNTWATVTIEDTGLGIPPEEKARLFQRFERGQASAALQVPGTGLGLAISKEIIDLHHGRITVESELGEGSAFTVWLAADADPIPTRPDL